MLRAVMGKKSGPFPSWKGEGANGSIITRSSIALVTNCSSYSLPSLLQHGLRHNGVTIRSRLIQEPMKGGCRISPSSGTKLTTPSTSTGRIATTRTKSGFAVTVGYKPLSHSQFLYNFQQGLSMMGLDGILLPKEIRNYEEENLKP